jgi:hypothetical protein
MDRWRLRGTNPRTARGRAAMARMTLDAAAHPRFARTIIGDRAVYPAIAAASDATLLAWTGGVAPAAAIRVVRVP